MTEEFYWKYSERKGGSAKCTVLNQGWPLQNIFCLHFEISFAYQPLTNHKPVCYFSVEDMWVKENFLTLFTFWQDSWIFYIVENLTLNTEYTILVDGYINNPFLEFSLV